MTHVPTVADADVERFAPIAVSVRSGFPESVHHGAGVVLDPQGAVAAAIGDPSARTYLRSALKIFQTEAMVRAGLDVPSPLLALVAASHSGERAHLDGVVEILDRHGCTVGDLANTPALPYGVTAKEAAVRAGEAPASLYQNCSGKHAGMLATCRVNGWQIEDYLSFDHPLQRNIGSTIESLGATVGHVGVDGCGAPTHVLGLVDAAAGLRRLALHGSVALDAMRSHPEMVGGTGRDVTEWMTAVPGLVVKDGAAGVTALVVADGDLRGWASVFKIADGSDDVRRAVVPAALAAMGVDVEAAVGAMASPAVPVPVLGGGRPVGRIEPLAWSSTSPR